MTGDEEKAKKDREPIFMVCFVVLLLASVSVLGGFVYSNYVQADTTVAATGDTVVVNYNGCYYDYFGSDSAVLFDTTYSSVANDSNVLKSNDFTLASSYSTLSFKVGGTTVLTMFGNAVIGHKVGDTITVKVPVGSGYVAQDTVGTIDTSDVQTVASVEIITLSEFEDLYGITLTGYTHIEKSVYGWPANAAYDSSTGLVTMSYLPVSGTTYTMTDSGYGEVTATVSSVGSSISYTYTVTGFTKTGTVDSEGDEIQMIYVDLGNDAFYITHVSTGSSTSASSFTYKTVGEKYNEALYFTITIVSIS
jgi:hypothetical protein